MYIQQHLRYATKGSYTFIFQYAAGSFGWSFETVGYLAYICIYIGHSYYPTAWILVEYRERSWRYLSNAHLAK